MNVQPPDSGIDRHWQAIQRLQAEVLQRQRDVLQRVAQAMAETVFARASFQQWIRRGRGDPCGRRRLGGGALRARPNKVQEWSL